MWDMCQAEQVTALPENNIQTPTGPIKTDASSIASRDEARAEASGGDGAVSAEWCLGSGWVV
ncbi:hypothetical protein E4U54_006294, partial [Claviceps lovelessii]